MSGGGLDIRAFLEALRPGGALPVSRRALRELIAARRALDALEAALVARARLDGATWREIGSDLGVDATAVRRRHPGPDPAGRDRTRRGPRLSGRRPGQ